METLVAVGLVVAIVGLGLNLMVTLALAKRLEALRKNLSEYPDGPDFETLALGSMAPDFEADNVDGETIALADFADRAVALIFMSPDCQPCVSELPALHQLREHATEKGVELVLVNVDPMGGTREFAAKESIELPLLHAPRPANAFASDYKAVVTPFYCLVNPNGRVESTGLFGPEWDQLVEAWSA